MKSGILPLLLALAVPATAAITTLVNEDVTLTSGCPEEGGTSDVTTETGYLTHGSILNSHFLKCFDTVRFTVLDSPDVNADWRFDSIVAQTTDRVVPVTGDASLGGLGMLPPLRLCRSSAVS